MSLQHAMTRKFRNDVERWRREDMRDTTACIALWHAEACCCLASDDETRYCPPCRRVADQIRAETIEEMRR